MGHSQGQALLEATILALVAILLLDLAGTLTALIFQFHAYGPPEKALNQKEQRWLNYSYQTRQLEMLPDILIVFSCSAVTHKPTNLTTFTGMYTIVEARSLVPADLTLHADA